MAFLLPETLNRWRDNSKTLLGEFLKKLFSAPDLPEKG